MIKDCLLIAKTVLDPVVNSGRRIAQFTELYHHRAFEHAYLKVELLPGIDVFVNIWMIRNPTTLVAEGTITDLSEFCSVPIGFGGLVVVLVKISSCCFGWKNRIFAAVSM